MEREKIVAKQKFINRKLILGDCLQSLDNYLFYILGWKKHIFFFATIENRTNAACWRENVNKGNGEKKEKTRHLLWET